MKLSWRDLFTSLIAIIVGVGLVAGILNYDWSVFGTWKGAVGTMGILGLFMIIFDEADFFRMNVWGTLEGLLALAGIGLVIAGLIVASKVLFVALAAVILAFWLVSLARHEWSHEPELPHAV